MKNILAFFVYLFLVGLPYIGFGQDTWTTKSPLTANQIAVAANAGTQFPFQHPDLDIVSINCSTVNECDESTLDTIPNLSDNLLLCEDKYVLSLTTNASASRQFLQGKSYQATIKAHVAFFPNEQGQLDSIENIYLSIDYDALEGKYKAKDFFELSGYKYYRLTIDSFGLSDGIGNPVPSAFYTSYNTLFELQQSRHLIAYERPDPNQTCTINSLTNNDGYLTVSFSNLSWATAYDVEWTYVDNYPKKLADPFLAGNELTYDFLNNSTRVSITGNSHTLPFISDRGFWVFRVRGIGIWGQEKQRIEGAWNYTNTGIINESSPNVYHKNETNEKKTWQFVTHFAEDGKRKDVMSYYDGTNRKRQEISRINSSLPGQFIAGSTIYDHQGRPALNFLPAPFQYQGAEKAFDYVDSLQRNSQGNEYSKKDFDLGTLSSKTDQQIIASKAGNQSGAEKYYSTANNNQSDENAYLPQANGYPFSLVEYTPDLTGRISRKGSFGDTLQTGKGKEQQFYYSTPNQTELDRMFGNHIGYAQHYKKDIYRDQNGQHFISYKDNKNNVIATALAGEAPQNLVALDNQNDKVINVDLLKMSNEINVTERQICSSLTQYISGAEGVPINLELNYTLSNSSFQPNDPNCPNLCYNCYYDYDISVIDELGEVVFSQSEPIGNLNDLLSCNGIDEMPIDNQIVQILPGNYTFNKCLRINEDSLTSALTHFEENCPPIIPLSFDPCDLTCTPCQDSTIFNFEYANGIKYKDQNLEQNLSIPIRFITKERANCEVECPDTLVPNLLKSTWKIMLGDMSPGGQYGAYIDTSRAINDLRGRINVDTFPLSVFNINNMLPIDSADWKHPIGPYRNQDGSEAWVLVPFKNGQLDENFYDGLNVIQVINGQSYIRPQHIRDIKEFFKVWDQGWAQALLPYHPEFFYYNFSLAYMDSYENDLILEKQETYTAAAANGLANTLNLLNRNLNDDFNSEQVFSKSTNRTAYNDLAITYASGNERSGQKFTTPKTAIEAALMNTFCTMTNWDEARINNCIDDNRPLFGPLKTVAERNAEWRAYRPIALEIKKKIIGKERDTYMGSNHLFNNELIGDESKKYYAGKTPRFPSVTDQANDYPNPEEVDDPTDAVNDNNNLTDYSEANDYYRGYLESACFRCDYMNGWISLLKGLFYTQNSTNTVSYPAIPPLSFPKELVDAFGLTSSTQTLKYIPSDVNPNYMAVSLEIDGNSTSFGQIVSYNQPLSEIKYLSCFKINENAPQILTFYGYTEDLDSTFMAFSHATSWGAICQSQIKSNRLACENTTYTDDLKALLTSAYVTEGFYNDPAYVLYNSSTNPTISKLGQNMEQRMETLVDDNIGLSQIRWESVEQNTTYSFIDLSFLDNSGQAPILPSVTFDLIVKTENYTISDLTKIIALRPQYEDPKTFGEKYSFEVIAEDANGNQFILDLTTNNTYFPAFLCSSIGDLDVREQALCCLRPIKTTFAPTPCDTIRKQQAEINQQQEYQFELAQKLANFKSNYISKCLNAAESMVVSYSEKIYHQTLYYFDQANNLIQTVPPLGVESVPEKQLANVGIGRDHDSGSTVPNHQLNTTYAYTSLEKLREKMTPDGGTSKFTYDEFGRFIQYADAQQIVEGRSNYTFYDDLGRVVEEGESNASIFTSINYYANHEQIQFGKSEIVKTIYDRPLSGTDNYFSGKNRQLRNRIAGKTYQVDPSITTRPYDNGLHYSYDILGNIKEFVQDFPQLEEAFPDEEVMCKEILSLDNQTITQDSFYATNEIQTQNTVEVNPHSPVLFQAGISITLKPGFSASGEFTAKIGNCEITQGGDNILVKNNRFLKKMENDFDLFSGKINRVIYQKDKRDQMVHWYTYDADNRVQTVSTSTMLYEPPQHRDIDAIYEYYDYGPLARVTLGKEQVQGIDYAYTLWGAIKGVNAAGLDPSYDMGKDGFPGSNQAVAKDAFGYNLGYFRNDYTPIANNSGRFDTDISNGKINQIATTQEQFNGNIWYNAYGIKGNKFETATQLAAYRYDQIGRLKEAQRIINYDLNTNAWPSNNFSDKNNASYQYDANGNITALTRKDEAGNLLDNLSYHYLANSNKLTYLDDAVSTIYENDLEDQSPNNYAYDASGALIADASADNAQYDWNNMEKLATLQTNAGTTSFAYNAVGQRILKETPDNTTFYVRDITGNIISEYAITNNDVIWKYAPIYGAAKRLGIYQPDQPTEAIHPDTSNQYRGDKQYELSNHVGNIWSIVSDRKIPLELETAFDPDILSTTDYYPFGMNLPGQEDSTSYAFGFQGMQRDDDAKGIGNSYTTEFRQYDPRVGRWMSLDPLADKYPALSPFNSFLNNPIVFTDPKGDEPPENKKTKAGWVAEDKVEDDGLKVFAGFKQDNADGTTGLGPSAEGELKGGALKSGAEVKVRIAGASIPVKDVADVEVSVLKAEAKAEISVLDGQAAAGASVTIVDATAKSKKLKFKFGDKVLEVDLSLGLGVSFGGEAKVDISKKEVGGKLMGFSFGLGLDIKDAPTKSVPDIKTIQTTRTNGGIVSDTRPVVTSPVMIKQGPPVGTRTVLRAPKIEK